METSETRIDGVNDDGCPACDAAIGAVQRRVRRHLRRTTNTATAMETP